jgi:hypothetical protein
MTVKEYMENLVNSNTTNNGNEHNLGVEVCEESEIENVICYVMSDENENIEVYLPKVFGLKKHRASKKIRDFVLNSEVQRVIHESDTQPKIVMSKIERNNDILGLCDKMGATLCLIFIVALLILLYSPILVVLFRSESVFYRCLHVFFASFSMMNVFFDEYCYIKNNPLNSNYILSLLISFLISYGILKFFTTFDESVVLGVILIECIIILASIVWWLVSGDESGEGA